MPNLVQDSSQCIKKENRFSLNVFELFSFSDCIYYGYFVGNICGMLV